MKQVRFASQLPEGIVMGAVFAEALEQDLNHMGTRNWVSYGAEIDALPASRLIKSEVGTWAGTYAYRYETGFVIVTLDKAGSVRVWTFADSPEGAELLIDGVQGALPERLHVVEEKVSVSFWTYSPHGPQHVSRLLDAPAWDDIADNYSSKTRTELARLFEEEFRPGHGGQFVLWHGEPGTGKTTALRSLARQWRKWCAFHYIADPDNFFGQTADYMLNVLLQGEEIGLQTPDDQPDDDEELAERWRVLILEDTGELLRADARERVGQALSRFLNVVDGMIGQGLRVLVFVTTNEPLGKLHAAVTRPGRGAHTVEFTALDMEEANRWLKQYGLPPEYGPSSRILADLYAELEGFTQRREVEAAVGFHA